GWTVTSSMNFCRFSFFRSVLFSSLCVLCASAVKSSPAQEAPRRITHDGKRKDHLCWAPDGRRLALSWYHQTGRIGVAVMDADGGNARVLTRDPVEFAPSWSPDGKRLVFVHDTQSGTDGELDIHQMNAD